MSRRTGVRNAFGLMNPIVNMNVGDGTGSIVFLGASLGFSQIRLAVVYSPFTFISSLIHPRKVFLFASRYDLLTVIFLRQLHAKRTIPGTRIYPFFSFTARKHNPLAYIIFSED